MIKINLLGNKRVVNPQNTILFASWIAALLVSTLGVLVACYGAYSTTSKLQSEVESLRVQLKSVKERTKSVRDLKGTRDLLDAKLRIIAVLKRSKSGPVRVMDDLNTAIPERSWITGIKESDGVLRIVGFALDHQTVASFMKELVRSEFFESVDLVESKGPPHETMKLGQFTLDARVRYGGKHAPGADAITAMKERGE